MKPRRDVKIPLTYQKAEVIYKLTFFFARTYLEKDDSAIHQMLLTARSAMLYIAKANAAAATSAEMEIQLTQLAKARLIKLRMEYRDYLSTRQMQIWEKDSDEAIEFRQKSKDSSLASTWYVGVAKESPPETVANMCLCLLHQADCLLQWQLTSLEKNFLERNRLKEQILVARVQSRQKSLKSPSTRHSQK